MKKLIFFAVLSLGLAISACSSDDDNGGTNTDGSLLVDGTEFELKSGMIEYWGTNTGMAYF